MDSQDQAVVRKVVAAVVLCLGLNLPLYASDGRFAGVNYASRSQAVILSALFPGLGQLATGHRYRGTALVASEMAYLVISLTSHEDYKTLLAQFDQEKKHYLSLRKGGSFREAEESWRRLEELKDKVDGSHMRRCLFGALAAAVYIYNLLDASFLGGCEPPSLGLVPTVGPSGPTVVLLLRF